MQISLILSVVSPDRPGVVDTLATVIKAHQGNWLESRMARLGGQFAGIVRIQLPANAEPALLTALAQLASTGTRTTVHRDDAPSPGPATQLRSLEVVGNDRPGIVQNISHALASHRVNVEELHTECSNAAMSGEPIFKASATIAIPDGCDLGALRATLEKISSDLIVEISLAECAPSNR